MRSNWSRPIFCTFGNGLKELQEGMGRCSGRRDITEITLRKALNIIHPIRQYISEYCAQKSSLVADCLF